MALTENEKRLIEAVARSDLQQAKKAALACVVDDTSKKNEWWCRKHKMALENAPTFLEVPPNLKYKVFCEDLSDTFLEARYFLSEREKVLYEHIVKTRKANEELTKLHINYLNSILLYGPSGTGKTTFGRYVAFKMGLPFVYINFSNLIDSLMGKTSMNLSLVFNFVRDNKCVFMIDEIDTISIRRAGAGDGAGAELARTTVTLMQELDKLSNEHIVIGATNRMDVMDEALLRRFSKKHKVDVLTVDEKTQMVLQYLNDVGIEYSEQNIREYCAQSADKPQSQIINEVVEGIIKSVVDGESFCLNAPTKPISENGEDVFSTQKLARELNISSDVINEVSKEER